MTQKQYMYVEQQFVARMKNFGYKPGSKKYADAQAEFFSGAMSAWCSQIEATETLCRNDDTKAKQELHGQAMPPRWVIAIMRGAVIETKGTNETPQS
jgi:hypothetical protein